MTQANILDLLSSKPNIWFTSNEIAKELNINLASVSMNCKSLRKYKAVNFILIRKKIKTGREFYKYKHKKKNEKT